MMPALSRRTMPAPPPPAVIPMPGAALAALQVATSEREHTRHTADRLARALQAAEAAGAARTAPRWFSDKRMQAALWQRAAVAAREHIEHDVAPGVIADVLALPCALRRASLPWRIQDEIQSWLRRCDALALWDHVTGYRIAGRSGRASRHEAFMVVQPYAGKIEISHAIPRLNSDPRADFYARWLPLSYGWHAPDDTAQQVALIYPREIVT